MAVKLSKNVNLAKAGEKSLETASVLKDIMNLGHCIGTYVDLQQSEDERKAEEAKAAERAAKAQERQNRIAAKVDANKMAAKAGEGGKADAKKPLHGNKQQYGLAQKKVRLRKPRPFTDKSLINLMKREAKKDPCAGSKKILAMAASVTKVMDWLDLIIIILMLIRELYEMIEGELDFAEERAELDKAYTWTQETLFMSGFGIYVEFAIDVLLFPKRLFEFFRPVYDFVVWLHDILYNFQDEIRKFINI